MEYCNQGKYNRFIVFIQTIKGSLGNLIRTNKYYTEAEVVIFLKQVVEALTVMY